MPDSPARLTGPVVVAGLLGGLLGGVASFAASRMIAPPPVTKSDSTTEAPIASEARQITDAFMAAVRDGADPVGGGGQERRLARLGQGVRELPRPIHARPGAYAKQYGEPSRQFELVREVTLSPSLVRLIYLEKYPRWNPLVLRRLSLRGWLAAGGRDLEGETRLVRQRPRLTPSTRKTDCLDPILGAVMRFQLALLSLVLVQLVSAAEPVRHRVLAQDKGKVAIISADGKVEWEYPCKYNSHDIHQLAERQLAAAYQPTRSSPR